MALKRLNNTTWKQAARTDWQDELNVVIGDDKQLDFKPQIKVERWNNEVNCSIRLKESADELAENPLIVEENGKIKHIKSKRECHFYDIQPNSEHPEGGYEFEIILNEKPVTNKIEFTLNTKGIDFLFQPELTAKEIADGCFSDSSDARETERI